MRTKLNATVCILAHNEEKNISSTIKSIFDRSREIDFEAIVYANGCTDDTEKIVKDLMRKYPKLYLRQLSTASKIKAWNLAFTENDSSVLIFSDGDIQVEKGTISALLNSFKTKKKTILSSCKYWPRAKGLSLQHKIVGFIQIPIAQDFLTGCFYAVKKDDLKKIFLKKNIAMIPEGIVGEDLFIELLVPVDNFITIEKKCFYSPPNFDDYYRYLARMKWQEKQLEVCYQEILYDKIKEKNAKLSGLINKIRQSKTLSRLTLGVIASFLRHLFIWWHREKINRYYIKLGPIAKKGNSILNSATRSISIK